MKIATDGSCLKNPGGKTGWAWVGEDGTWQSGSVAEGTNNIGELLATLNALKAHREMAEIHLLLDSQYVLNVIQKWGAGWRKRGWKKADGEPVKNAEIVAELLAEAARPGLSFEWVKGHNGNWLNELADNRAGNAARLQNGQKRGKLPADRLEALKRNGGKTTKPKVRKSTPKK